MYLNQNGELADVNNPAFKKLGLVSGAVFGDLDSWRPDLVLASMGAGHGVRTIRKFTDATKAFGLTPKGW